jgi:hypothetical protein
MIVDNKNNLNIYKDRGRDDEETSCCATNDAGKEEAVVPSCCVPPAEIDLSQGGESKDLMKRAKEINFNEWVSKCTLALTRLPSQC